MKANLFRILKDRLLQTGSITFSEWASGFLQEFGMAPHPLGYCHKAGFLKVIIYDGINSYFTIELCR